ncbi:MAG: hypothetical protein KF788_23185, partial [Piscinibacter sp.]|nr:hypothetical protein [Piscinibacter sp.]
MGLIEALGLRRTPGMGAGQPPVGGAMPSRGRGADAGGADDAPSSDPVVARHDEIAALLAPIADEAAKAPLENELAGLRATHAKAGAVDDAAKRATLEKAELAAAARLQEKVRKLAAKDALQRELSDSRADVQAVLSDITALVLGGLQDDKVRKSVNDELGKLQAAFVKAGKLADPKSATTAYQALLGPAQALRQRAQGAKDALDLAGDKLAPQVAQAQAALAALPAAPKGVLQGELETLRADMQRYAQAGDTAALQSIVAPRLKKLAEVAAGIPKVSQQVDADLARADKLIRAVEPPAQAGLQERLKALQAQKKAAWPAGASLDELAASVDGLAAALKTLIADTEAAQAQMVTDREVARLRAALARLGPRIDKAGESPVPSYIEQRQGNVKRLAAQMREQLDAGKPGPAGKTLATLQLALDDMEKFKGFYADFKVKFDAAENGPIKAALAVKLQPAELAASRDKAVAAGRRLVESRAANGVFAPALSAIDRWVLEAKAWAHAKEAYDNLHGSNPKAGKLEDLCDKPGGGLVLDALVADLDGTKVPQKVFIAAIKARFGTEIEQFEHRKDGGNSEDPDKKTKVPPDTPDKDLQGLYKVLRMVPTKDVGYVEKINRFTKDKSSGTYSDGVFTDTIALHCGRHGGPEKTYFDLPGVVMPVGESVDPNCAPLKPGDTTNWHDFTVMHEVGHAVDDARDIMKGDRAKDAGWDTPGTGHIAEKIAKHLGYDAGYIEDMLDDANSNPPKKKPGVPDGKKKEDWDAARVKAEAWVKAIRVGQELWDNAAGSKAHAIDGRVYHEAYAGHWVSYKYAARSQGITGYQFRAPAEWFAELYAAYYSGKLNPKHTAASWLHAMRAESVTG